MSNIPNSCQVNNPVNALLNTHAIVSQQIQEAKAFQQAQMNRAISMQQAKLQEDAMVRQFEFQQHQMPKILPPPPQLLAPPPIMRAQNVDAMVNEFAQMEIQRRQKVEFEMAFQASKMSLAPNIQAMQWANAFAQQQSMIQQQVPLTTTLASAPITTVSTATATTTTSSTASVSSSSTTSSSTTTATTKAKEETFDDIYEAASTDTSKSWAKEFTDTNDLQTAYEEATGKTGNEWVDEFNEKEKGMGGGLSKDMLDKLKNSNDPKWRNSKFLQFLEKVNKGEIEFKDNVLVSKTTEAESWASEFEQKHRKAGPLPSVFAESFAVKGDELDSSDIASDLQAEAWAEEFEKLHPPTQTQQWTDEFTKSTEKKDLEEAFKSAQKDELEAAFDSAQKSELDEAYDDSFSTSSADSKEAKETVSDSKEETKSTDPSYGFAETNPYLNSKDPMAEGIKLLKEGKLKEAILAFEAEVQKNPENAEAWRYLGEAQADNEQEQHAIAAFSKAISIDPYNLKALLNLGVSYTNDLEEDRAITYLKTWLLNHPDYQTAVKAQSSLQSDFERIYSGNLAASPLHDEAVRMFLAAVKLNPKDPDLHTVLGVLYHISSDFDKAIEAFKTALKLKPDDPALWNKLGATQANSERSADAVHAYQRALELRPGYVRALTNLAISYANQGLHGDAAPLYLSCLARNPDASHIWSYLRISLSHLGRDDLVELTHQKNADAFKKYFKF
eukprot:TRINITY_DN74_c4_g1_i1.p1 TRINITY_DN74_c4_g1~~TRINITY_DN74_c4_g1_i1.p1  ORF type:complete len:728 (+),score=194.19 TRINITY_DN74_c4_g1_i1:133-2316(+)